jgi:hypothetical protein
MLQGAEHGLYIYELDTKGERPSVGLHPAYFAVMRDFVVRGAVAPNYPGALVVR